MSTQEEMQELAQANIENRKEDIQNARTMTRMMVKFGMFKQLMRGIFGPIYTAQKIALYVAIVALIIILILLGIAFHSLHRNVVFPPHISSCPDFFRRTSDNQCYNVHNLGNGSCAGKTFNFNSPKYMGPDGIEHKYKRARECGWEWDGVTNNTRFREV